MNWFRRKPKQDTDTAFDAKSFKDNSWIVYAPVQGEVIPQDEIQDKEFASGALGPGVAIVPSAGSIYAPASGILEVIFQQGHALGLVSDKGIKLLLHIGTDSVAFNGIGFKKKAWEGDHVKAGQLIEEFDRHLLREFGLNDTVIVSISNFKDYEKVEVLAPYHHKIEPGQPLLRIVPKA